MNNAADQLIANSPHITRTVNELMVLWMDEVRGLRSVNLQGPTFTEFLEQYIADDYEAHEARCAAEDADERAEDEASRG